MPARIGLLSLIGLIWSGSALTARAEEKSANTSELWSLRRVAASTLPVPKDRGWAFTPIDHFVIEKLEKKGLRPAPVTDKRTLIRRATYDLTGLPPSPDEVQHFLQDESPAAFSKLIERLLSTRSYGERWGRHWLDVVRYADTAGDNSDYPIPQIFRYRNWVIDAFNRDLPYDEFVRQQLAGDLLPSRDEQDRHDKIIATGYLANTRRFGSYDEERYPWYLTIEDTIDNLGRTFLGLTVNCCRCHDHKFDPLTQHDYYALYGFFSSTRYPRPGIELDKVQRDFVPLASDAIVESSTRERKQKLAEFDAKLKRLSEEKTAAEKEKSDTSKKQLETLNEQIKAVRKDREEFEKKPLPYETAYAVVEGKTEGKRKLGNASVQIKGDPERQGPEVPRRFPTVLGGNMLSADVKGSGRLELANWIVDANNPLFARVMVNRIWQYHFGRGIVPTPSDFGKQGQPPTHPELLDWLANRFVESGYSIKAMHRLIMASRTYQLATTAEPGTEDADNEFYSYFNRRRLDAESIRDTLLAVSGSLDVSPGGPHPFPEQRTWNFTQHAPFKAVYDTNRRSVYLMTQRIQRHPFLALFDGADTNASTATRLNSTTSLQALFLMNDPFVHSQASKFAARILAEDTDDTSRIERAYWLLFSRLPTAGEKERATDYLARVRGKLKLVDSGSIEAWESLTRALFMSNEFVYTD